MLLGQQQEKKPVDVAKLNCAGQGCSEREYCRRFRVRIGGGWQVGTGQWGSFDLERAAHADECRSFVRWHGDRVAA